MHTSEQDRRPTRDAMPLVCSDTTIRKSTPSQESPLSAVVPKAERVTKTPQNVLKAKEALISQTCP